MNVSRDDVRNAVEVAYFDEAGVQHVVGPFEDAASIATFGRQFMRLAEPWSSGLNTAGEAEALGRMALADLSWPRDEPERAGATSMNIQDAAQLIVATATRDHHRLDRLRLEWPEMWEAINAMVGIQMMRPEPPVERKA